MKQKELLFIVISITFVAVMWIIFSILHQAITSTISQTTTEAIQPINGSFDSKTIEVLKKRTNVLPQTGIAIPTPIPSPTPALISPAPQLQIVNIATEGGQTQ